MDTIVTGAASELIACAYFLRNGYHVFRSVNVSCPIDVVVYQKGICYRVEVKTLTIVEGRATSFSAPRNSQWDILAVVNITENKVHVFDSTQTIEKIRKQLNRMYTFVGEPRSMPCGRRIKHVKTHIENCEVCLAISKSDGIREALESLEGQINL